MKTTPSSLSAMIRQAIGFDVHGKDFDELLESAQKLTHDESLRLLEAYRNTDTKELGRDNGASQEARVHLIRFLVALFPLSCPVIESWLLKGDSPEDYEIHFTLFCYLDQIPGFGSASDRAEVLRISENYLRNIRSNTGDAAWMAGDMLSDHWEAEESLPVLLRVAQKAHFVEGRSTGLDGLELLLVGKSHALAGKHTFVGKSSPESRLSAEERATVRRVLRAIGRKERNPGIRLEAARLLKAAA